MLCMLTLPISIMHFILIYFLRGVSMLTVQSVIFQNCNSGLSGGAIFSDSPIAIYDSAITNSVSYHDGMFPPTFMHLPLIVTLGGGLCLPSPSTSKTIIMRSIFSRNIASGAGGAISVNGTDLVITNTTITYNNASSFGGGIVPFSLLSHLFIVIY